MQIKKGNKNSIKIQVTKLSIFNRHPKHVTAFFFISKNLRQKKKFFGRMIFQSMAQLNDKSMKGDGF